MIKKVVIVIILLIITVCIITYFGQYNLNEFSIIDINIERNDTNYKSVKNAIELEETLLNPEVEIIEITNDIDLGYNLIKDEIKTGDIFQEHNLPLTHPKLKNTGVSKLRIENKENLIIYSANGSSILHCNIRIENSKNIKIYNLSFKELWEWDEEGKAEYDRNDWDYITIRDSENICISNCEYSKAYDGITDVKDSKNVTIEYCKLDEIDVNDDFFDEQFKYLENNKDKYEMYSFLRDDMELSYEEVKELFSYQFKVFLIENDVENSNIVIHDCLLLNAKTRNPLMRNGKAYVNNVYADSRKLSNMMDELVRNNKFNKIRERYDKVVALNSYGVIAEDEARVYVRNTVFEGAKYPYVEYDNGKVIQRMEDKVIHNEIETIKKLKQKLEKTAGVRSE